MAVSPGSSAMSGKAIASSSIVAVSEIQTAPSGWLAYLHSRSRQTPQSASKAVVTNSSLPTVQWSDGMQLIYSDDSEITFYVNVTLFEPNSSATLDPLKLILDTGSAYMWVYGEACKSSACTTNPLYAGKSLTESTFELAYGSGTAKGNITTNTSVIINNEILSNFSVGVASEVPALFDGYLMSGVLGLPANSSNGANLHNVVTTLQTAGSISNNLFTISLGMGVSGTDSSADSVDGLFVIGEIVDELYSGEIHYAPVEENTYAYWMLTIDQVYVESYPVTFNASVTNGSSTTSRRVIVDSGTTVLVLPSQDASTLHSYFPNSITDGTNYAILCNTTLSIAFEIAGANWTLTPADYLGAAYPALSSHYGYCVSNIQGVDGVVATKSSGAGSTDGTISQAWLLGSVFLKKVFAVFDIEGQRLGLAQPVASIAIGNSVLPSVTAVNTGWSTVLGTPIPVTTEFLTHFVSSVSQTTVFHNSTVSSPTASSTSSSFISAGILCSCNVAKVFTRVCCILGLVVVVSLV
ncbi:hypothetical protein BABINDRAFT_159664 [Babjeviella inositovora NRRL Y-12698]|uniref:Peptidase A1 domain-containing protein n=1 Tax=Babjeviella inositovora NRRL Y-12698 TaxID=984486 RepID=A0A1E3R047_9ASCO|nr:uncharacterized protein BABINDRAFT_159664 [Babjeviella inositovora NRRL Y-12698]ODQ83225.1 hypothetical protein BABINDRAFT_159664 [Babjeviella inositovora NRRL Y-12698]